MSVLNDAQKKAVETVSGPVLIIAGAGAGKTRVITERILNLIRKGVDPRSILAITFTNKAAKEMRDRVRALLDRDKDLNLPVSMNESPFISTFHSLGVHIIRQNASLLGLTRHFSIFDRSDSRKAVKDAMVERSIDPKKFDPSVFLNIISKAKGDGLNYVDFRDRAKDYMEEMVSETWERYDSILAKQKALDFDDLLLKTANLLGSHKELRDKYGSLWKYIHIDEYQDTNGVQYRIAKYLAESHHNICVVGDADQCLLPNTKIKTQDGSKEIKKIKPGEKILSASGSGKTCLAEVERIKTRAYNGDIVHLKTANGKEIRATPNHILFARLSVTENFYYVYLMFRRDKGFRIGLAKSVRHNGYGEKTIGLLVRCNQEKADRMWVLKICPVKREAIYWEEYFSAQYGIPKTVFSVCGRKLAIQQEDINNLFKNIDTTKRSERLFSEMGLYFNYPHYYPQGTTHSNTARDRVNINLNMFSDRRKSLTSPWGMSRISINTTDTDLKNKLEEAGFKTRKGKIKDWRLEITRLDYGKIEEIATKIQFLKPKLNIVRSIFLTRGKKMFFQPASSIIPGMVVGVLQENGEITEEKVISVKKHSYKGKIYDLDVRQVHNYIANNITVHNCIYSWRGATIQNLLDFETDYPEATVITLEKNYRSTKTILSAANNVIEKNVMRKKKTLFTDNDHGEKISMIVSYTEKDEARVIAETARNEIDKGVSARDIAVLYRANFQSRVLEEAFIKKNIPYQLVGVKFFERKEVKDVISYIRAALNQSSWADIGRIINVPPRGIGKATVAKIMSEQESTLPAAMRDKIANFRKLLNDIMEEIRTGKPSECVKFVIRESGIEKMLQNKDAENEERLLNIRELVTVAAQYDHLGGEEGIEAFLENAALASDQDELSKDHDAVKLMTVHASKGLEFNTVFVAGLEQDLFPFRHINEDNMSKGEEEEERRLFYVALTRAQKKIYLSYAIIRTIYGAERVNAPSEFIEDIEKELIEEHRPEKSSGAKALFIDF